MQDSTSTAETQETNSAEGRAPTESQLTEIANLLTGGDVDDQAAGGDAGELDDQAAAGESDTDAEAETSQKQGKPKNLTDLAERLGVKVEELYAIEIPFGDNAEPKSLGDIKDAFAERDSFEVDRLAWEETKTKKEAEFLRSASELTDIINMLPKSAVSRELLEKVASKRAELVAREEKLTVTAIPEWADEAVEDRDRVSMREHLNDYGFPANYLESVLDHRTLKFIRDATQRKVRIEKALAQVKTVKKPGHKPSGRPGKRAPTTKPRKTRQVNDQVSQVAELLNG